MRRYVCIGLQLFATLPGKLPLQRSVVGATLLTVVDQFTLRVLNDSEDISDETFGKSQCTCIEGIHHCRKLHVLQCEAQNSAIE